MKEILKNRNYNNRYRGMVEHSGFLGGITHFKGSTFEATEVTFPTPLPDHLRAGERVFKKFCHILYGNQNEYEKERDKHSG